MAASGFDTLERIDRRLPQKILNCPLNKVGFREGDVFHAGCEKYFEITGDVL